VTQPETRRTEARHAGRLAALVGLALVAGTVVAVVQPAQVVTTVAHAFARDGAPPPPAATPRPLSDSDAGGISTTSPESAERQAALVAAEDARITDITSGSPPSQVPYAIAGGPQSLPTTVLTARSRPYDLPALQRLGAAERAADGAWVLVRSVVVSKGAMLSVQEPGATLRLTSGPAGFASIVAFKGGLMLAGDAAAPLTVTSWDPATRAPDTDSADGRSYIRAIGAKMDVSRATVSELGFWSGRTGGLAWTGSSSAPATGSMADSVVSGGHYGVFSSRTTDLVVTDSTLQNNDLDGLLVHRESTHLTARDVTSVDNGRDGIAIVRGAELITVTGSTTSHNAGDGIRVDGSPLADTATAGGASTARGSGYTVDRSTSTDNAGTGILTTSADKVVISGNTVGGSTDGIVVRGPAADAGITGNTVDAAGFAIAVRGGVSGATVRGNTVRSAAVGLHVTDSVADLGANTVTASRYGVSLVGDVSGTSVIANTLTGRGLAAVDLNRIAMAATADVAGNDDGGWVVDRDDVAYWTGYAQGHPLLLLWLLILLVPIGARAWFNRHRQHAGAHPYQNVAPGPAESQALARTPLRLVHYAAPITAEATGAMPEEMGATALLPVTRVTVVSGRGGRR
jgi:hypothetical protein